jgi:hypothetical protein
MMMIRGACILSFHMSWRVSRRRMRMTDSGKGTWRGGRGASSSLGDRARLSLWVSE